MAATSAKLGAVAAQICDTMLIYHVHSHRASKAHVARGEIALRRLREAEAAILESLADHRRVLSPFRNLPEDILREICIACVEDNMPVLAYRRNSLPYILAQISSGMRCIVLETPCIWAAMNVEIGYPFQFDSLRGYQRAYSLLAQRASEWFDRADGLALTVFIEDTSCTFACVIPTWPKVPHPSNVLLRVLLMYSPRWKALQISSRCVGHVLSIPMMYIAALRAVDVPLLQSLSLRLNGPVPDSGLHNSALLTIPTLKHVKLDPYSVLHRLTVNWAILTSVTLRRAVYPYRSYSKSEIASVLQQTKHLVFCDINVGPDFSDEYHPTKIRLHFLKTLIVSENPSESDASGAPSILDLITPPILEIFHIRDTFLDRSLSDFLGRSPHIKELSLPYLKKDSSLMVMTGLLRHCASLAVLSLWPCECSMGARAANKFLRAFVEEGDAGVVCPRLQYFNFTGRIVFSPQTLRLFLEGKQGDIALLNVLPWKRVVVDLRGIKGAETCKQMLDHVSQMKAAGLNVQVREPRHR